MARTTRFARFTFVLLPLAAVFLLAAAPLATETPDDLIRRANEALRAGDAETADQLYTTAEERTADPGLVAFNRARDSASSGSSSVKPKSIMTAFSMIPRVRRNVPRRRGTTAGRACFAAVER